MKLQGIRALPGPNVYIHRPVLVARIELEELTERESNEFPGFVERSSHSPLDVTTSRIDCSRAANKSPSQASTTR